MERSCNACLNLRGFAAEPLGKAGAVQVSLNAGDRWTRVATRLRFAVCCGIALLAIVAALLLPGAASAADSPPRDDDLSKWSGIIVAHVTNESQDDPSVEGISEYRYDWDSLAIFNFTQLPEIGGTTKGDDYMESTPAPDVVCTHERTWDETYPLTRLTAGDNPGLVHFFAGTDNYTLDSAHKELPITYTDVYAGDPFWCANISFETPTSQPFPFAWDQAQATYSTGDTKLQGEYDVPFAPSAPQISQNFCWRLTWLPDGDHDGLPDDEDPQPSVFDGSICQNMADLSITKTDSPDPLTLPGNLTYTLTVANAGPDAAAAVSVSDTLPAGVSFVSATPSAGSCSGTATITCTLGSLPSGASATVTIVVTPTAANPALSNTATVTSTTFDPVSANSAGATTVVEVEEVSQLDHFKCYKTKQLGPRFDPRQVVLADQFNTQRVNVVRPETFCNPAGKDGSGINNPTAHLTCYKIRDVRGDEFPKFRKQRVEASDQFGTHTLLLKKIRTLCLPSSKSPAGEVPGPPPTGLDHFKCYKTRQLGTRFDPRRVILTDQFNEERVNVVRPEAFCTPVDKDGSGINNPTAHLTCYKIRDVRGDEFPKFRKRPIEAGDQFGTHSLLLKKTRTLCLPSSKAVL